MVMLMRGKAQKLVMNAGEGEGFEAWRFLVRRYKPKSLATTVGRLIEVSSTVLQGPLADSVADFELCVMLCERDSGAKLSDSLKVASSPRVWTRILSKSGNFHH